MTTDVEIPKSTVDVHSNLEISLAPLSLPSGVGIFPGVSLWSSRAEPKTPEPLCIEDHVFTLRCKVQNYAWGKKGLESTVAQLQSFTEDITRKLDLPFAELWMGTHSSGPSWIQTRSGSRQLFSEHLMQNTNSLGPRFLDRFNIELGLPFLFKVLSVETALSIQAHPDKKLAEKLHTRFPDVYKDDNHKPELACALTHFEALCEFRPVIEIAGFLSSVSEFRSVIGEEAASRFENFVASPDVEDIKLRKAALKKLYARLMSCAADDVKACLLRMVNRLNGLGDEQSEFDKLLLRVYGQYPGDIGVFSLFFLNYVTLQPGEALYLGPNLPHAYLSGDCVEIMATSDNVVRAGLTPKFKDVNTLCAMLTYEDRKPVVLTGERVDENTVRYAPTIDEFALDRTDVAPGQSALLSGDVGPSIVIVCQGSGQLIEPSGVLEGQIPLQRGAIFYVPSDIEFKVEASAEGLQIFRGECGALVSS